MHLICVTEGQRAAEEFTAQTSGGDVKETAAEGVKWISVDRKLFCFDSIKWITMTFCYKYTASTRACSLVNVVTVWFFFSNKLH